MVRGKKSTMFLMSSEGDTVGQVKRKLAAILREDAGAIGLFQDKDGAMVETADQTLAGLGLAGAGGTRRPNTLGPGPLSGPW